MEKILQDRVQLSLDGLDQREFLLWLGSGEVWLKVGIPAGRVHEYLCIFEDGKG